MSPSVHHADGALSEGGARHQRCEIDVPKKSRETGVQFPAEEYFFYSCEGHRRVDINVHKKSPDSGVQFLAEEYCLKTYLLQCCMVHHS
jgi:hypothetical protein